MWIEKKLKEKCPACGQQMDIIVWESVKKVPANVKTQALPSEFFPDNECPACGMVVDAKRSREIADEQAAKEKKKKSGKATLIVVLLLIAALAAAWFIAGDQLLARFVYRIEVQPNPAGTVNPGDTVEMVYTVNFKETENRCVTWASSDPNVAIVDEAGMVKTLTEGTTTITASVRGVEKDSCMISVALTPVAVENGKMIVEPVAVGLPTVTVHAPKDANCVAYFQSVDGGQDFAFYVAKGETVKVNTPVGRYSFFYVSGDVWYGSNARFGPDSSYYKTSNIYEFAEHVTEAGTEY